MDDDTRSEQRLSFSDLQLFANDDENQNPIGPKMMELSEYGAGAKAYVMVQRIKTKGMGTGFSGLIRVLVVVMEDSIMMENEVIKSSLHYFTFVTSKSRLI
ncbi:hypothetical protein Tco_1165957 [Tanacetum coccineum]